MTRFARARGSKGSNEKVPEEATPWKAMKNNLKEPQNNQTSNATTKKLKKGKKNVPTEKDLLTKTKAGKVEKPKKLKLQKKHISKVLGVADNEIKTSNMKTNGNVKPKNLKQKAASKKAGGMKSADLSAGKQLQKKRKISKLEKIASGTPYKRRKSLQKDLTTTVNGKNISVVFFDGFKVRKEDAIRLEELHKKLIESKVSKEEVKNTMKLERRKAEKVLVRELKKVCFHCRISGHLLSECPELASEGGTGICFKCGSTEHKVSECRVGKVGRFPFAKCFVCSEQGHISSQCPNNSKGLYPKGGSCHVCGEVTHLKKDCPKLEEEQDSPSLTVDKINESSLEGLDFQPRRKSVNNITKGKKGKKVVF